MPVSYEKEALKAQAVCARTYAYRQIQGNSYKEYGAHVDDSTRFQVYNNLETSQASDAAVTETYGKVLQRRSISPHPVVIPRMEPSGERPCPVFRI